MLKEQKNIDTLDHNNLLISYVYVSVLFILAFFFQPISRFIRSFYSTPIYFPYSEFCILLLLGGSLFFLIYQYRKNKLADLVISQVTVFFGLYILFGFFSSLWAVNFARAFYHSAILLSYFILYCCFKICIRQHEVKIVKLLVTLLIISLSIMWWDYATKVIQQHMEWRIMYPGIYTSFDASVFYVNGMMGHKNSTAIIAYLCSGILLMNVKRERSVFQFISRLLLSVSILFMFLMLTRSVLVALLVAVFIILFYSRKKELLYKVSGLVLLLSSVYFIFFGNVQKYLSKLNIFSSVSTTADSNRIELFKQGLQLYSEHPLLGIGKEQFTLHAGQFGQLISTEGNLLTNLHNEWWTAFVELGPLGFVLFASILLFQIYYFRKKYKKGELKLGLLITFAFLIAYQFIILFENLAYAFQFQYFLMFYWALLECQTVKEQESLFFFNIHFFKKNLFIFIGILFFFFSFSWYSGSLVFDAKRMQRAKKWNESITLVKKAYSPFYTTFKNQPIKSIEGFANLRLKKSDRALQNYRAAAKKHPYDKTTNSQLGRLYVEQGEYELAENYLNRAMQVDECFEAPFFHYAKLMIEKGAYEEAKEWLELTQKNPKLKKRMLKQIEKQIQN